MGPGPRAGFVGTCKLCGTMDEVVQKRTRARRLREVDRKRTAGFGPAPEGVDIFAGHRED